MDAVRQSRIAYANAKNNATNQGASGSSGAEGGQSSIISQLGGNLSFLDKYTDFSNKASTGLLFAGIGGGVEKLGSNIFANQDRVRRVFG